jgi:hypothetical protein
MSKSNPTSLTYIFDNVPKFRYLYIGKPKVSNDNDNRKFKLNILNIDGTWDRCYDFLNISPKKSAKKLAFFDSK